MSTIEPGTYLTDRQRAHEARIEACVDVRSRVTCAVMCAKACRNCAEECRRMLT